MVLREQMGCTVQKGLIQVWHGFHVRGAAEGATIYFGVKIARRVEIGVVFVEQVAHRVGIGVVFVEEGSDLNFDWFGDSTKISNFESFETFGLHPNRWRCYVMNLDVIQVNLRTNHNVGMLEYWNLYRDTTVVQNLRVVDLVVIKTRNYS
jgi:hypothetical protein